MKQKKGSFGVLSCGFRDHGHLQYYSGELVSKKRENPEKKFAKMKKKQMKLVKDLRKDLLAFSEMGFVSDVGGLLNEVKANIISETAGLLLEQIQKIKSEEKELKRMIKQERKSRANSLINLESSSSSSDSSSSSESSDSDREEVVNMKTVKQHHPLAEQKAPSLPVTVNPSNVDNDPSSETSSASVKTVNTINENVRDSLAVETATHAKKIEVCIGGKCKKSGSATILDEFQRVLGVEGSVSGCKCMGKCKSGPVVKVSNNGEVEDDHQSVRVKSDSLCLGVGLDDVSTIVANLLSGCEDQIGFAASG